MSKDDRLIGQQIDSYKIKRLIGKGGMAAAYLAEDVSLKREVVLKVMLPGIAEQKDLQLRFQREAQATARLEHPNIVPIYATGTTPTGQPYLALQYIEGGDLSDQLTNLKRQGQWISTIYALSLVRQIADALTVAHAANIIHRDLKPSNILLRQDGTPVVSDLGIAAVQQATMRLTQTGGVIGTPNYMSPEQASSQHLNGRSDIYSLGVMLYELLSGHLPFDAASPLAMMHNHIYEPPTPLQQIRPDLAPATCQLVATCLQKSPINRYPTAAAMIAAIDQALQAESRGGYAPPSRVLLPNDRTELLSTERVVRAPGERRLQPVWILGGGLLALIIIAAILFSIYPFTVRSGGTPPLPTATQAPEATPATALAAPTAAIAAAATELPTATPAATSTPSPTETPQPTPSSTPTYTPTSEPLRGHIVYDTISDVPSEIYIMNADGSNPTRLTFNDYQDDEADLSPDGRFIAYESRSSDTWTIMVMNSDGSNPFSLGPGRLPDWSPDGRFIAYETVENPQRIALYDVQNGTNYTLSSANQNSRSPSWSPDGQELVIMVQVGTSWQLAIINANNTNQRFITRDEGSKRFPVWSPTGNLIAFNTVADNDNPGHIWVIGTDGNNLKQLTQAGFNGRPAWSPDGQYLVFNSNLTGPWLLYRIKADGSERMPITTIGDHQRAAWGP